MDRHRPVSLLCFSRLIKRLWSILVQHIFAMAGALCLQGLRQAVAVLSWIVILWS